MLLALVTFVVLSLAAPACLAGPNDLLAEGAGDRLWAAHVVSNADRNQPGQRTIIRVRGAGESERWRQVAEIAAPAKSLTHRGDELVVLLDDPNSPGDWRFVSDSGVRSGNRLPGDAPVLALAGEGDSLWAVGLARSVPFPATRGSTHPTIGATTTSPATTGPTTTGPTTTGPTTGALVEATTAPVPLAVFRLDRGEWKRVATLPPALPQEELARLAMTVVDGRPVLAAALNDGSIRTAELTNDGAWSDRGTIKPPFEVRRVELVNFRGRPTLWIAGDVGAGLLQHLNDDSASPVELKTQTPLGPGTDRAIAVAFGRLRLLYQGGDGKLFEQPLNVDGSADSPPTQGAVQPLPPDPRVTQFLQLGVMVLLMFVMLSTLRRRSSIQEAMRRADKLALAPHGSRFLAGVIDALPLLAVPVYVWLTTATPEAAQLRLEDPGIHLWWGGSVLLYIAYATVAELVFARTLGKLLLGLRVADLTGARPTAKAIVLRNILRLVDVLLLGFPLIMVLLSPLRQRVGDVAAGTLVVRAGVVTPPSDDAPPVPLDDD
ncbi:MAG: RDD family protein [Tepidisphaeraceae bacterium]